MFCAPAGAGRKFWIFWMHPRPGEVCLADLDLAGKTRPVVIVSRSDPDAPRALVVNVPLTTQNRESRYEVPVPKFSFLNAESVANVGASHPFRLFGWSAGLERFPEIFRSRSGGRYRSHSIWIIEELCVPAGLSALRRRLRQGLFANQFLQMPQFFLNDSGNLFGSAFRFQIGIVNQFAFGLFGGAFCIVKIAFNLLLCAVCHFSSSGRFWFPIRSARVNSMHV